MGGCVNSLLERKKSWKERPFWKVNSHQLVSTNHGKPATWRWLSLDDPSSKGDLLTGLQAGVQITGTGAAFPGAWRKISVEPSCVPYATHTNLTFHMWQEHLGRTLCSWFSTVWNMTSVREVPDTHKIENIIKLKTWQSPWLPTSTYSRNTSKASSSNFFDNFTR